MTTTLDVVNRTFGHVLSTSRGQRNVLASTLSAAGTSVSFADDISGIARGSRLSVDLEHLYVRDSDTAAKTATILRGEDGSTAAEHTAGKVVYVNPVVTAFEVVQAANDELHDLSSPSNGLFRVRTVDLTASSATTGYDLTSVTDLIDIIEVRWKNTGTSKNWPLLRNYTVVQGASTSDFASGKAILISESVTAGQTIRVTYRSKYATLSTLADNVETTTGLHEGAHDLLWIGAAIRLLAGRPNARTFMGSQGDTRRAEEVTTSDMLAAPSELRRLRQSRIAAESARLASMYPRRI